MGCDFAVSCQPSLYSVQDVAGWTARAFTASLGFLLVSPGGTPILAQADKRQGHLGPDSMSCPFSDRRPRWLGPLHPTAVLPKFCCLRCSHWVQHSPSAPGDQGPGLKVGGSTSPCRGRLGPSQTLSLVPLSVWPQNMWPAEL